MLLYEDLLYFLDTNRAILSCVDAKTGEARYTRQRLEGLQRVFASPVAANDRVYVAGRNGKTAVIQSGPAFKLLATNSLDESFTASPVIAGREIFLRGRSHLYCIAHD
jgi:outer membrane protein assembly factor BamB